MEPLWKQSLTLPRALRTNSEKTCQTGFSEKRVDRTDHGALISYHNRPLLCSGPVASHPRNGGGFLPSSRLFCFFLLLPPSLTSSGFCVRLFCGVGPPPPTAIGHARIE